MSISSTSRWRGLTALAALCVLLFVVSRFSLTTSITSFVDAEDAADAQVARTLAQSDLARTMILAIGGSDETTRIAAARYIVEQLGDHPEVQRIVAGISAQTDSVVYELYFPRRFLFASDEPERDLPARLSQTGLQAAAHALQRELASPSAMMIKRIAAEDPLLLFPQRLEQIERAGRNGLRIRDGNFIVDNHALVLLTTRHSPFDATHQAPLEEDLEHTFAELKAQLGAELTIERSAVHRLALQSERDIRHDLQWLSACGSVGLVVLFLAVYRSLGMLLFALVPMALGILAALAVTLAVFGSVHGLTLAFGTTLLGVCIDYPVHYLTHLGSSAAISTGEAATGAHASLHATTPRAAMRAVERGIVLGAATTIAGFVGMSWTSFPGIREIGWFASVGVTVAMLVTWLLLPRLIGDFRWNVQAQERWTSLLEALARRVRHRRGVIVALSVGAVLLCAIGLPRAEWVDDARALNRLQPLALAEDERVRALVGRTDLGRFIVARGATVEEALQRNEAVSRRLSPWVEAGKVRVRSLHPFLWSRALQRRNLRQFRASEQLTARFRRTFAELGFRPEAFVDLEAALESVPAPLVAEDLLSTPLASAVAPFLLDTEAGPAVVTFVEAVDDARRLHEHLASIEGVSYFDQRAFMTSTYRAYRERVLRLLGIGLGVVLLLLLARYRRLGVAVAAFLPAVLAAGGSLSVMILLGQSLNLLHLLGVLLVLSMGVDYGVFLAETSASHRRAATMLGLLVACISTVFAFGLLAFSRNPALAAVGATTGLGVSMALLLAPLTTLLQGRRA